MPVAPSSRWNRTPRTTQSPVFSEPVAPPVAAGGDDDMVRANRFAMLRSEMTCWKCGDRTPVAAIWIDRDLSGNGYEPVGEYTISGKKAEPSEAVRELLKGGTLSSDAKIIQEEGRYDIKGDPTEGALVVAAAKAGMHKDDLDKAHPRVSEIPFTSETKRMPLKILNIKPWVRWSQP